MSCAKGSPDFFGLMQNAGQAVAKAVQHRFQPCRVLVVCGPGNNGGDGYIAAEVLRQAGWPVLVGAMDETQRAEDAARAAKAYGGERRPLSVGLLDETDVVVDALFGTGLQRTLNGNSAEFIEQLNVRGLPVVAVDIPSGIDGDTGRILGVAAKAQATVTFFRKKIGHVLFPGALLCGEIIVGDIGVDESVLGVIQPGTVENAPALWKEFFPYPKPENHKYDRGHALIYGGPVMTGAARLGARAAQRMGAGLVTLAAPKNAVSLYATALESVIVRAVENPEDWHSLLDVLKMNSILIGPGMGFEGHVKQFVLEAVSAHKKCVLDADALTLFAEEPEALLRQLHSLCVLTPHEGEFARLFGKKIDAGDDKLSRARKAAKLAGCLVLLKGPDTIIADPDGRAIVNHNAPPWLATAGAGDVLAGMIVGLMASGMAPWPASAAAAYVHGHVAALFGGPGMVAEDLIAGLPCALQALLY